MEEAKEALGNESIVSDLVSIQSCYMQIVKLSKKMESSNFTIEDAYQRVSQLNFGRHPYELKAYIHKRLQSNADAISTVLLKGKDISPAIYSKLKHWQASSAAVERSFSLLK